MIWEHCRYLLKQQYCGIYLFSDLFDTSCDVSSKALWPLFHVMNLSSFISNSPPSPREHFDFFLNRSVFMILVRIFFMKPLLPDKYYFNIWEFSNRGVRLYCGVCDSWNLEGEGTFVTFVDTLHGVYYWKVLWSLLHFIHLPCPSHPILPPQRKSFLDLADTPYVIYDSRAMRIFLMIRTSLLFQPTLCFL